MNLLDEAWIPVRRKNSTQDWIAPWQIGEPDIVALDSRRPDFNGALIQFLIGLVQTTTPMNSHAEWQLWYDAPPSIETLKRWFAPVESAFVFDGDGARFMQDFGLRTADVKDAEFNDIGALLMEAPGDNTLKENKDHFIKRGSVTGLCPHCAATALFTLQTNAPSGGNGHFTSLRGGGPLTTLIVATPARSLWHTVWLNVRERASFVGSGGSDANKMEPHFIFPWIAAMQSIQSEGGKTAPIQVHPAHVFWGMPRRIRLDLDAMVGGLCDICGRKTEKLLTRYITKAKGFDYKGPWRHPLSPYYENKPEEWLPVHPQPGGLGYKHWLGLVLGMQGDKKKIQPASIISYVLDSQRPRSRLRLWAFGYDMDNMKARCWYESTFPLYGLAERNTEGRKLVQSEVAKCIDAADHVAFLLRSAVRSAWFSERAEAKGDWGFIDAAFWSRTEPAFYNLLRELVAQGRNESDDPALTLLHENWRKTLIDVAIKLFDAELVGAAPIERQNPRRVAEAHNRLRAGLHGDKLKEILKLPVEKRVKPTKKSAKAPA
ncbi:MAG TPA: type I-E CRISPR-associated protein Cse1/CasA [Gammaproteobacteria bacterium]|nr:type I-E CRISPR-associated protein Cse1/CasA [Gammaproteobacteria bacterium]